MMKNHFEVDDSIMKSAIEMTLHRSDKALVEIKKDTFAVAIKGVDLKEGYVFYGNGKLLVDAIVETERGALGKPIQCELDRPFLMLGNTEELSQHLEKINDDDLKRMNFDGETILEKARNLLAKFTGKRMIYGSEGIGKSEDLIFAFENSENNLDTLLLKSQRLVYAAKDMSFISDDNESILNDSGGVVLFTHGRSLVVNRVRSPRVSSCR